MQPDPRPLAADVTAPAPGPGAPPSDTPGPAPEDEVAYAAELDEALAALEQGPAAPVPPVESPPAAGSWPYPVRRYELWAPAADVLPLVTHAVYAVEHDGGAGAALLLLQEGGLFLCSSGLPHQRGEDAPGGSHLVPLRAPRGRLLDRLDLVPRYSRSGDDWVVGWPLDDSAPARVAAVGPRGRVVVRFTPEGPRWRAEAPRPSAA